MCVATDVDKSRSMSRDDFVQDIPPWATSVSDIPDTWQAGTLPFDREAVIAAVLSVAPSADFSDPTWGRIDLPGVSIEVNVGTADPLQGFAFHVRASDAAAGNAILRTILHLLGVRAFDSDAAGGIFV
jgi:hypothetical protein